MKTRKVFATYDISYLETLKTNPKHRKVSARLRTFIEKGTTCVRCGLQASYLSLEITEPQAKSPHLNLYGVKDGKEILFTRDHILPRFWGGSNSLDNSQPMCFPCNYAKGATREGEINGEKSC